MEPKDQGHLAVRKIVRSALDGQLVYIRRISQQIIFVDHFRVGPQP